MVTDNLQTLPESETEMMKLWILEGPDPVEVTIEEWGLWFETHDEERIVARTKLGLRKTILVSTVFLGMDHNFWGEGPPILFETMVFRDGHGDEQRRYATWQEAYDGHYEMVKAMKKGHGRRADNDEVDYPG